MNKKGLLPLIFILPLLLFCCKNQPEQPQVYGEKPLHLEWLSFDMDINKFFPDENLRGGIYNFKLTDDSKEDAAKGDQQNWYSDDAEIVRKAVTLTYEASALTEIFHYSMLGIRGYYRLAAFGDFFFSKLNISTTMWGKLVLVHVSKTDINEDKPLVLLKNLKSVYGEPQIQKAIHDNSIECDMYTWETDDRIIVYYWMPHNSPKENSQEAQMYILKKEYKDILVQRLPLGRPKDSNMENRDTLHIVLPEVEEIEEEEKKYMYIYAYDNPNVIWVNGQPNIDSGESYLEFEVIPDEEYYSYDTSYTKLSSSLAQETDSMFCIIVNDEEWCFGKETNFDYGESRNGYKWSEYGGYYPDLNLQCIRCCTVSELHGFSSMFLIDEENADIYYIVEYGDSAGETPVLSPGNEYMAIINSTYEEGYVQNIEVLTIQPDNKPKGLISYFNETKTLDVEFADLIWINDNEFIVKAYETTWKPENEPKDYTCYKVTIPSGE